MTPEDPFDMAVLNLRLSHVRRLDAVRRSPNLPYGARLVRGGVAIDAERDVCGWLAYADREDDLQPPCWPEQIFPLRFDDVLGAAVELVIVYRGGDWRRAVGAVNTRLNEQCTTRAGGVEADLVEHAWMMLAQQAEAARYREARREFERRSAGGEGPAG
jgi:hypothetical protein